MIIDSEVSAEYNQYNQMIEVVPSSSPSVDYFSGYSMRLTSNAKIK